MMSQGKIKIMLTREDPGPLLGPTNCQERKESQYFYSDEPLE